MFKGSTMRSFVFLIALFSVGLAQPHIRNLHARYDPQQNLIYVIWSAPFVKEDLQYQIKYRNVNKGEEWSYKRTSETEVELDLQDLHNGDQIEVEVKSELDGGNPGQSLIINVVKQVQVNGLTLDEEDPLPPLNFKAHIEDPYSVKLSWKPHESNGEVYYIVNVKQLTPRGRENLLRQQIKVDGTQFLLQNLEPGEKYEFTIRTATLSDQTSSTAAIVEFTLPSNGEYFEVGTLMISSKFKLNGVGTVNLTWNVPEEVKNRIKGYHVEYTEVGGYQWRTLYFDGSNPTILLNDMQSNTEYVLKIRTVLQNDLETESGEFTFKTPKVPTNPINKVEIIYSSETTDVQVKWEISEELSSNLAGYIIYVNEDPEAYDQYWRKFDHNSLETSIDIPGLKSGTVYYVRIDPKTFDNEIHRSSVVYRFRTLDQQPSRLNPRHRMRRHKARPHKSYP